MTTQASKHSIGLAGEFLVAGELLRRGIMAAVTYGNAKKADVIAVNAGNALSIEVKSTSKSKWVIGSTLPAEKPDIWVLVYLPPDEIKPPEYLILTSAELRAMLMPQHKKYTEAYRKKHKREFSGKGVVSITRTLINESNSQGESCSGNWQKIKTALDP